MHESFLEVEVEAPSYFNFKFKTIHHHPPTQTHVLYPKSVLFEVEVEVEDWLKKTSTSLFSNDLLFSCRWYSRNDKCDSWKRKMGPVDDDVEGVKSNKYDS